VNEWPLYAQQRWAGKRVQRLEDPGMLTGAISYVTDVQLPRMLELAFVSSPAPHARITSIDVDAARSVPGVRAVLGPGDLAHVHPTMDFVDLEGALKTPRVTLPGDRVRYVGEPVAAVVADDRYAAEDGADAVIVALEPLDDEPIHDGIPDGRHFRQAAAHGDVDAAFARAAHVVRRRLAVQRVVTSPLETCGIVADYDAATSCCGWPRSCSRPRTKTSSWSTARSASAAPRRGGFRSRRSPGRPTSPRTSAPSSATPR